MTRSPQEIDMMLTEIAAGLKAGDCEVYGWLHTQMKECNHDDAVCLAMGVICRLMPQFADGARH
jgi:hypothetical protein